MAFPGKAIELVEQVLDPIAPAVDAPRVPIDARPPTTGDEHAR